ncbi:DUF5131 family protein [Clostridium sp. 'deep sea']|uniref:DUF5131 family protein n=1 Tax=Clostridium sp. 'deep sea' TaxID=2779445 RepID=UPI0018969524|nr:DUF5131 family protein [Clostridium sp. 'deep sea']QOR35510.1 DUF5131 family protein [Clostridium sp. 'deep sea']
MTVWNPWRGCHKKSEGCKNCYIHRANARKGINTDIIYKTEEFYKPIAKDSKGNYKMKSGQTVYVCFNSDFFVKEADDWRCEVWNMMKTRHDLNFFFITKRIERFKMGLPPDYQDGYDNVTISISVENQLRANERIPILKELPIKHKAIAFQPLLEKIDISNLIDNSLEYVVVGGESGKGVRPLNYEWVLDIREQCMTKKVSFIFRQVGSIFIKDAVTYKIQKRYLCSQARDANINYNSKA